MTIAATAYRPAVSWSGRLRLGAAVVDQGMISLINLGLTLFLVHFATPTELGLFGLGYATLMLAAGVANALVLTQMSVIVPRHSGAKRKQLLSEFLRLDALVILAGAALASIAGSLWACLTAPARNLPFVLAAVLAVGGWLLFDFGRRANYLSGDTPGALRSTLVLAAVMTLCLCALLLARASSLHVACMALLGIAAFVAALQSLRRCGLSLRATSVAAAWTEARLGAGWALAGMGVTWLLTYSYTYLLGVLESPAELANANAARLLVAPPMVLATALALALLPRLAAHYGNGRAREAERITVMAYGGLLAAILVYLLLLWGTHDLLVGRVLGASYAMTGPVTFAWGVVLVVSVVRAALSALLQARRQFRALTLASAVAAAVAIAAGFFLIPIWHAAGGVSALALSELVLACLLLRLQLRHEGAHAN